MSSSNMSLHRCLPIATIITVWTTKWFFTSVNQNMSFYITASFHSFRAKRAPEKRWTKSDRFTTLKNNQRKKMTFYLYKILKENISNAFFGCVLLEMCFDYKQKNIMDMKMVFLQCESRYVFSYWKIGP